MKLNLNKAKINYLYHDGFIIETKSDVLIFDYFNDDSKKRTLQQGVVCRETLQTEKNVFVFVSHSHSDHFNPIIFSWKEINPNIKYILSTDIEKNDDFPEVIYISEDENIKVDDIEIKAYGSTDIGISFLVKVDGISVFHAGDLNWWHWKEDSDEENSAMEKAFKKEVEKLSNEKIDIAFFPVDHRLGEYYYLGGEYLIEKVKPKLFIPMHFGDKPEITKSFKEKMNNYSSDIVEIHKRGQEILF